MGSGDCMHGIHMHITPEEGLSADVRQCVDKNANPRTPAGDARQRHYHEVRCRIFRRKKAQKRWFEYATNQRGEAGLHGGRTHPQCGKSARKTVI
ncbi:hypothetical protein KCP74_03060 [Salmonella enterica subsp. enterica]|nr:hypothetical protein KCP74_03060 [Salmonella enterica subsp. enterica]